MSSFGFSGTNAHILIGEAPADERAAVEPPAFVLTLSARSSEALESLTARVESHLDRSGLETADICFTANTGRAPLAERVAYVGATADALRAAVRERRSSSRARAEHVPGVAFSSPVRVRSTPAWDAGCTRLSLCSGTRSITAPPRSKVASMCRCWRCSGATRPRSSTPTRPTRSRRCSPSEYRVYRLWTSWGVHPTAIVGHSVGEYAAATAAGVYSVEDGLRLIAARGRLTGGLPRNVGAMAAILAPRAMVEELVARHAPAVTVAAYNGPEHLVVAGAADAVAAIESAAAGAGFRVERLRVSHAFHSPLMGPVEGAFEAEARRASMHRPRVPLVSSVTGRLVEEPLVPAYWRRQLTGPVRFDEAIRTLAD